MNISSLIKTVLVSSAFLLVWSCASTPVYHPAETSSDSGFSEVRLDETHYRVLFKGDASTSRHDVEDYLLRRAAELTVKEGYTYFHIDEKSIDIDKTIIQSYRPAFYGGLHRHHLHDRYEFPYYAYGFEWGYPYDSTVTEYKEYSAAAYITLQNYKSNDTGRTFNAADILASITKPEN